MTIMELAEALNVSRTTIDRLRKLGWFVNVPGIRRGMKFPVSQLENYLRGVK